MSSRSKAKAVAYAPPPGGLDGEGPRYLTRSVKKRMLPQPDAKEQTGKNRANLANYKADSEADLGITDVQQFIGPQRRSGRPKLRTITKASPRFYVKKKKGKALLSSETTVVDLNEDVLEHIVGFLDTQSALNLFLTCKTINERLTKACGFWYQLCLKENFNDYHALKQSDEGSEQDDTYAEKQEAEAAQPVAKRKRRSSQKWVYVPVNQAPRAKPRTSFTGELLHCVKMPAQASYWRKVWLRGLQMRRNVVEGRFEMWRLFMTDKDHLPVKKMTAETSHRELRSAHRNSTYNTKERHVRISRYWTEEYMIVIQYNEESAINDIFVWEWDECQSPKFKFVHSLFHLYPEGLSPMSFFLWKQYLVLAPNGPGDQDIAARNRRRPLIRVHDISDSEMRLVSGCDMPEVTPRFGGDHDGGVIGEDDCTHLHKMGDYAFGLVRVPEFRLFVFSLPDSKLVKETRLNFSHVSRPLEDFKLEQRFLTRKNVMYFIFSQPDYYGGLGGAGNAPADDPRCFGRLVRLDFDAFLAAAATAAETAPDTSHQHQQESGSKPSQSSIIAADIQTRLCEGFCFARYPMEKIALIGPSRLACLVPSGAIHLIDLKTVSVAAADGKASSKLTTCERQVIPAPGRIMSASQFGFNVVVDDDDDFEEPAIVMARDGDQILVLRHFQDNHRRIHAYETAGGLELYSIDLDAYMHPAPSEFDLGLLPPYKLSKKSNCLSIDMDGNFLCVSDTHQVVIWNSKTGRFVRQITIPKHYQTREDDPDAPWQGHTDFAFAEDGLVIVHNKRNFPIAADILLF